MGDAIRHGFDIIFAEKFFGSFSFSPPPFLPAAKPAGHRMESVVLLLVVAVVGVTTFLVSLY